ncbi:MAG: glycoside hydrolase family 9 protein [Bacillota bacterium]|nr:glycoside hydrolase family 9 protein [Bacillota bacterium]
MLRQKTSKFFSTVLAVSMLFSISFSGGLSVKAADQTQMLANFETDTLNGFKLASDSTLSTTVISRDNTTASTGSSSLCVSFTNVPETTDTAHRPNAIIQLDNPQGLGAGSRVSFDVKASTAVYVMPVIKYNANDADYLWQNDQPTDAWTTYSVDIPSNKTSGLTSFAIQLMPAQGDGKVWIDNIRYTVPAAPVEVKQVTVFDFEDGTTGGFVSNTGDGIIPSTLVNSGDVTGTKSLKVSYASDGKAEVVVNCPDTITAGATVTMEVYVPSDESVDFQPFALGKGWEWVPGTYKSAPPTNQWTTISTQIPSNTPIPLKVIGVQILSKGAGYVYIDNVKTTIPPVDKSVLEQRLSDAQKLYDAAQEGTEIGQYQVGAKADLKTAIDAAKVVDAKVATTQAEINAQVDALSAAINTFQQKRVTFVQSLNLAIKPVLDNGKVKLSWNTAAGTDHYIVERGSDYNGPFTKLDSNVKTTSYVDAAPLDGNNVYLIAAVDAQGVVKFSQEANLRTFSVHQQHDASLFYDRVLGGWTSKEGLTLDSNGWYPTDNTAAGMYNTLPSLHIKVTAQNKDWDGGIAPTGWDAVNLAPYYENGSLEFNIKGANGGEDLGLQFGSKTWDGTDVRMGADSIARFVTVTKDWQHVSIPLKSFIGQLGDFDLSSVRQINIKHANGSELEVWINDMRVVTPDSQKVEEPIKVNQLGYITKAAKYALVSGFSDTLKVQAGEAFEVKNAADNKTVYSGKLTLGVENDAVVSGEKVLKADFSDLQTAGTYYVAVAGLDNSPVFKIGDDIYNSLLVDAQRYYYYQRAGMALDAKYAGDYARGAGIPQDSSVTLLSQYGQANAKKYDVSGGWYDAGDYGKYTSAAAAAVSDLLWTYEIFPSEFKDASLNIPESGNKTSDLLDEIRYELDFMLKMQDTTTGGFYAHVWDQNADKTPDKVTEQDMRRYIQDIGEDGKPNTKPTPHTADAVAALAHSYVVYKNIDPSYAYRLLAAAVGGWGYLEAHPEYIGSKAGEPYTDPDDKNDRLWAAAELYRATGDKEYNDYFLAHYKDYDNAFIAHYWGNMQQTAFYSYMSAANPDKTFASWYKEKFNKWSKETLDKASNNIWGTTLGENDYSWGSNSGVLGSTMDLYIGNKVLGNNLNNTVTAVRTSINYILGVNPLRISYVSGYGEDCVKNTYSNIYKNDANKLPPSGYLAGGPNQNEGAIFSQFHAKAYVDSAYEWTTNEHTIYWNSALVFNTAAVATNLQYISTATNNGSNLPKTGDLVNNSDIFVIGAFIMAAGVVLFKKKEEEAA